MRKTLFKWHSYLALVALLPLVIVSITGSILVFKTEIDQWMMPQVAALPYAGSSQEISQRGNHDELTRYIEAELSDYIIGAWELFSDGVEADRVYLIRKGTDEWFKIYFDPFSSTILSAPAPRDSYLTDWLLTLHYTFMLNGIGGEHSQGGTVLGVFAAFILCFLGVSGLIIHRKFWRQLLLLRSDKSLRIFLGDAHRLIGAWASPVILVLGITGMYFNIMALYHEWFEHPAEEHYAPTQKLYGETVRFQSLLEDSGDRLEGFVPTYMVYPYEPEVNITIFGHQPHINPFASNYASRILYDRSSGELVNALDGRDAGSTAKVVDSFRELHFGSFAGTISKILWSVLGLSPLLLGFSGLYLWFKRRSKNVRQERSQIATNLE